MSIQLRVVPERQLRAWIDVIETAFGDEMRDERWKDFRRILEPERALGAFDGEAIVGGGAAFSFSLTVPGGGQVSAAGVTAVGVLPTHRRRGILSQLMDRQLADAHQRGEAAAILWASEGGIYQRYGYGLASLNAVLDLERERAIFRRPVEPSGTFRLLERQAASNALPSIYDTVGARTPGFYHRSETWWDAQILSDYEQSRRGATAQQYVLHERDGRAVGYAIYRIKPDWGDVGTKSVLQVIEALATDAQANEQIWRYLFGVDLIARIASWIGPPDHPLVLMLAEPRRLALRLTDGLWLRIVDVAAALEARRYLADGELILDVADEVMPDVAGRYRLLVEGGRANVAPTDDEPHLSLEIADLGAVYLGAFSFSDLARAGRTVERVGDARLRADAMFATSVAPWCPEIF